MGKGNPPIIDETEGFQRLGHSNWTICSPLSPFCSENFPTFPLLYWEANSYYPKEGRLKMGKGNPPTIDETEGFQCLGNSNWTICSPLCQFCSGIFPTCDFHAPDTLGGKGTQGRFLIPVKIPAEYVSLMPKLPENAKIKIIYGGTHFSIGFTLGNSLLSWIPLP